MEYAIGNTMVAISWSDYLTSLLSSGGIDLPPWMTMDYLTAHDAFKNAGILMESGKAFDNLAPGMQIAYAAWESAPPIGSFHLIVDLPALAIIRSEEHTSELQSLMRLSYAVFCLKKK